MKQLFVAWLWMLSACSPQNEIDSERTGDQLNESAALSEMIKRVPQGHLAIRSHGGRQQLAA